MPTILITGASAGIGAALARRFATSGYRLVLLARRKENLIQLKEEIGKADTLLYPIDLTDRASVQQAIQDIEEKTTGIDLLINNAGMALGLEKAQESDLSDWQKCVDINIAGLMYCTHCVLPYMVKRNRGHIIQLGSVAGSYPYPGGAIYCATKAFVHQFSLSLRADLLGTQVRVSCIEPGLVGGTEFSKIRFRGDEKRAKQLYAHTQPLTPEDVAEVIHFTATLPPRVNINTIELMPVEQAFSPLAVHRTGSANNGGS